MLTLLDCDPPSSEEIYEELVLSTGDESRGRRSVSVQVAQDLSKLVGTMEEAAVASAMTDSATPRIHHFPVTAASATLRVLTTFSRQLPYTNSSLKWLYNAGLSRHAF